jgi:hypothetical protein
MLYVARVKEYGRLERRHSSFYIGLYGEPVAVDGFPGISKLANPKGQTWLNFKYSCIALVASLIRLNTNKRKYYQQGLRAMKLIESTF